MAVTILDAIRAAADGMRSTLPFAVGKRITTVTLRIENYAADIADGSTAGSNADVLLDSNPPVKKLSAEKASFFGANPAMIADGKACLATYRIGPITPSYITITSPVIQTGTGTGVVDLVNVSDYGPSGATPSAVVKIMAGGSVGTATFKLSTDGGTTYGSTQSTAASVTISGTYAITFTGTFNATDLYAYGIRWGGWDIPLWLKTSIDTKHRHIVVVNGPDTNGVDDICKVIECDATSQEISTFITVQSTAVSP